MSQEERSDLAHYTLGKLWNSSTDVEPVVYAIIDGASNKELVPALKDSGLRYNCLYEGKLSYDMELASPYLVRLEQDNAFTEELLINGPENNWCIYLVTYPPVTMLSVLRQARKNQKVLNPKGNTLIFRYFDPRILRNYLPSCSIFEAGIFYGPVDTIICNSSEENKIHRFIRTDHGIIDQEVIDIDSKGIKRLKSSNTAKEDETLKIRQDQLILLGKTKLPSFFKRAGEYVIKEFPEFANHKKDTLAKWIEDTYNQAVEYGLKTEREHFKFINYKCIFGNDFMEAYDFAEPIMQAEVSPGLKLTRLKDAFMEHLNS